MRKLIVAAMVSLDGVMQAPGGPHEDPTGGFRFGGWMFPHSDETTGAEMGKMFDHPFALVLGRKTYDIFNAYWPVIEAEGPEKHDPFTYGIGESFGRARKYMASRTRRDFDWKNSEWLGVDPVARLAELKREEGPELLTQGSAAFLQTLLASDVVDELRLITCPVVLGRGKRLFEGDARPAGFALVKCVTSPSGVVMATYARDGVVKTGSFPSDEPSVAELERRANWK